ncbi:aminoglycoside 3-N-acetyltransferase [Anaerocolumna jejuensis DSM 15929]|uniref:Aminoglycoside N(3)-acetyltransferase n=1 Tax=Anaerocolumna jejuensis DSM 15929 TaxID=1121322 RepID=A0A1M6Q604_9FIRM|nr:AAC(3) family N-acetyltransferase [Anaerocolumna jejuensis]SHK15536.1 aminoglycoside 3-N-acetyltransferase [Anaerocolumna jejuensis DSM 15929]
MHTKNSLIKDIEQAGIRKNGTLLIHSSMKAVGVVEGGADTVLDAFIEYMKEGLLLFPTHSWSDKNLRNDIYDPKTEPSCVGVLPNLFMKREGAIRSMHPTHSVTAMGDRAQAYVLRDREVHTPCPRNGCFGGLYDEEAQLLFLGATLKTNTFIHSIEEWLNVPDRINPQSRKIKLQLENGDTQEIDYNGHYSTRGDVSKNYDKLLLPMLQMGIAKEVKIGDAVSYVVEVRPMTDWVVGLLKEKPSLFDDGKPIE